MTLPYMMRRPEVERAVGLSRSSIYAAMARNDFPKPIRIGKRAVGWRSDTIEDWLSARTSEGNIK